METNSWSAQTTTLTFWGDQQEGKNKGFAPGRGRGFGKWATEAKEVGASRQEDSHHRSHNGVGKFSTDKACFRCKGVGHLSKECASNVRVRGNDKVEESVEVSTARWGNPMGGFNERQSHTESRSHKSRATSGCYKCGADGHLSRECDFDIHRRGKDDGHFSRACRQQDRRDGRPRLERDKETEKTRNEVYVPDESLEENLYLHGVNSGINFSKYEDIPVKVTGDDVPSKIDSFAEAELSPLLMENISKSRYEYPTPIQKYALPMVLDGRDVMGCAQTGSGKTAAFLIPIIHKLIEGGCGSNKNSRTTCPEVVIMSPTRELAIQIKDEARKFCKGSELKCVVAYGGTSVQHQTNILADGCNILVATPGRLNDFVEKGRISYSKLQFLVLDEADRMLEIGFKEDIIQMVRNTDMPNKGTRQTLMFSATYPDEVQKMAFEFMTNYLFLAVGIVGGAASDISQSFLKVPQYEKREKLMDIVRDSSQENNGQPMKTLVFVETKKNADFIASYLCQSDFAATSIHGDRQQREREEALKDFKANNKPILVATAVAARGLDIRGVQHVVNYDLPKSIEEYVHRIGRTGRLGNTGKATSFFDEHQDSGLAGDLVRVLNDSSQVVPNWLEDEARRNPEGHNGTSGPKFGAKDIRTQSGFSKFNQPIEGDERWDH